MAGAEKLATSDWNLVPEWIDGPIRLRKDLRDESIKRPVIATRFRVK
jgi:hypothetical protein